MMAHALGYPTDIDRQPDRKERSQGKQKGSHDMTVETKKHACLCKYGLYINLLICMQDRCGMMAADSELTKQLCHMTLLFTFS